MSNQFPSSNSNPNDPSEQTPQAGYGQQPGGNPQPESGSANQAGSYGASGYGASTGEYQGYQAQSNYSGYGQNFAGYANGTPQPGEYGQQPGATPQQFGGYPQQQAGFGQAMPGQDAQHPSSASGQQIPQFSAGYGQPTPGQPAGYGGYVGYGAGNIQPGQPYGGDFSAAAQPGKKGMPAWGVAVIIVAALALIGGSILGGLALFGDGNGKDGYRLSSNKTVADVNINYVGNWQEALNGTYASHDGQCGYFVMFDYFGEGFHPDDVDGSLADIADEALGLDGQLTRLDNIELQDSNGQTVEFAVFEVNIAGGGLGNTGGYVALHPFAESGDALMFAGSCLGTGTMSADEFKNELLANTEFTLVPEEQ